MSKKHKLQIQEEPYASIAIICPEGHLKLSWLLNNTLNFEFREHQLSPESRHEEIKDFPTYIDTDSNPDFCFKLIKNKFEGRLLLKSLPNIDFILKIEGKIKDLYLKEIAKRIKTVPNVLGAILLEKKLKDISMLEKI